MQIQDGTLLKEIAIPFFDKGKYIHAIEFFSKALEYIPNDAEIYDLRGMAYFRIMEPDKAIKDIEKAIDIDITFEDAYSHLADIYLKKHDYEKAEYYNTKAAQLNKESIWYKKQLAFTKYKLKKFEEALAYCDAVLEIEPDDVWTLKLQIGTFIAAEYYKKALDQCLKFPEYLYEPKEWHQQVGYLYGKIGNAGLSIDHLGIAIKLDENDAYCLNNLGYAYYLNQQYRIALDLINQSLLLDVSNAYAYKNRALVRIAMGEKALALEDLKMAQLLHYAHYYGPEVDNLIENINN